MAQTLHVVGGSFVDSLWQRGKVTGSILIKGDGSGLLYDGNAFSQITIDFDSEGWHEHV